MDNQQQLSTENEMKHKHIIQIQVYDMLLIISNMYTTYFGFIIIYTSCWHFKA